MLKMNNLQALSQMGQDTWLNHTRRDFIESVHLQDCLKAGVVGITFNTHSLADALQHTNCYELQLAASAVNETPATTTWDDLKAYDTRTVADLLRECYGKSRTRKGFVTTEINPHFAYQTQKIIEEAKRLQRLINRPNVMFRIPATVPGIQALQTLTASGIHTEATQIFSLGQYNRVALAYINGLADYQTVGGDLAAVRSVASFDPAILDEAINAYLPTGNPAGRDDIGIATGKLMYRRFQRIFSGPRWRTLAASGATVQRLMFIHAPRPNTRLSTRTIDALIGPDTIAAMTPEMLYHYATHGRPYPSIDHHLGETAQILRQLARQNIDIHKLTEIAQFDAIGAEISAYDDRLALIKAHRQTFSSGQQPY